MLSMASQNLQAGLRPSQLPLSAAPPLLPSHGAHAASAGPVRAPAPTEGNALPAFRTQCSGCTSLDPTRESLGHHVARDLTWSLVHLGIRSLVAQISQNAVKPPLGSGQRQQSTECRKAPALCLRWAGVRL